MTAPATAWDAHEISHINNPVAIDEHHHHDDDGAQASHGHGDQAPGQEEDDGGHDHMPSFSATFSAILLDVPAAVFPALVGISPPSFDVKVPVDLIEPPPARPPRSV